MRILLLTVVMVTCHTLVSGRWAVRTPALSIERNGTRRQGKVEPDDCEQAETAACCRAGAWSHWLQAQHSPFLAFSAAYFKGNRQEFFSRP
jgi:hypothetical protein